MKSVSIVNVVAQIMLYTAYITMVLTFTVAYFNHHVTLVTLNTYGEAHVEAVLILLTFPCVVIYSVNKLRGFERVE